MVYIPQDKFAKRARREGFRARSAYKLLDLQRKFKILKAGDRVLDLGAAPGGWIQVASPIVGQNGLVVAVDIEAIDSLRLRFKQIFQKNVEDEDFVEFLIKQGYRTFDVVLSDVAPNTTGIKERDQALSHELCLRVFEIVTQLLDKKGNLVMKIFEGPDTPILIKEAEKQFFSVKLVKPEASTKGSKELYLVARDRQTDKNDIQ